MTMNKVYLTKHSINISFRKSAPSFSKSCVVNLFLTSASGGCYNSYVYCKKIVCSFSRRLFVHMPSQESLCSSSHGPHNHILCVVIVSNHPSKLMTNIVWWKACLTASRLYGSRSRWPFNTGNSQLHWTGSILDIWFGNGQDGYCDSPSQLQYPQCQLAHGRTPGFLLRAIS